MALLNIVVTCSNRKKGDSRDFMRPPTSAGTTLRMRAMEWIDSLGHDCSSRLSPLELYAGDHWSIGKKLPAVASGRGWTPSLWIASAGYGLVSPEARLRPYSATFTLGKPDSVGTSVVQNREWWKVLAEWAGPPGCRHRSMEAIAEVDPESTFLVVLSAPYLSALWDDLETALRKVNDRNRFIVVSAGTSRLPGYQSNLLPGDSRLQATLGGALSSLSVRLARHLLETYPPDRFTTETLSVGIQKLIGQAPERVVANNAKMDDDEVIRFVRKTLKTEPKMSQTAMLRVLRQSGKACEQSRFKELFQTAKDDS